MNAVVEISKWVSGELKQVKLEFEKVEEAVKHVYDHLSDLIFSHVRVFGHEGQVVYHHTSAGEKSDTYA